MILEDKYYGTGKRKSAIARVWLKPGTGQFSVNQRTLDDYFPRETLKAIIKQAFILTETVGKLDAYVNISGGGISAQAEAIRHGISKALTLYDPTLRVKLKSAGFLTRDPRVKERKKYGQRGARARYQFSKR